MYSIEYSTEIFEQQKRVVKRSISQLLSFLRTFFDHCQATQQCSQLRSTKETDYWHIKSDIYDFLIQIYAKQTQNFHAFSSSQVLKNGIFAEKCAWLSYACGLLYSSQKLLFLWLFCMQCLLSPRTSLKNHARKDNWLCCCSSSMLQQLRKVCMSEKASNYPIFYGTETH